MVLSLIITLREMLQNLIMGIIDVNLFQHETPKTHQKDINF